MTLILTIRINVGEKGFVSSFGLNLISCTTQASNIYHKLSTSANSDFKKKNLEIMKPVNARLCAAKREIWERPKWKLKNRKSVSDRRPRHGSRTENRDETSSRPRQETETWWKKLFFNLLFGWKTTLQKVKFLFLCLF